MPVIEVSINDLERIAGLRLGIDELLGMLELMKGEVEEVEGDKLVFEASHDRPDLFSAEGLGRALRYLRGASNPSKPKVVKGSVKLRIVRPPPYRPYALLSVVRNVKLDDEAIKQLFQLQEKLHATHCGDRSLVSIGLYDLDKVKPPITYTCVSNAAYIPLGYSEKMSLSEILSKTEKGIKYRHLVKEGSYPLLVDSEGNVLSFPPILNAEYNKVTVNTRNVVIDVTGTEPNLMMKVLNVVTFSVLERGYGDALIELVKVEGTAELEGESPIVDGREFKVGGKDVENVLGLKVSMENISNLLRRMGYIVLGDDGNYVRVWVPPYRVDVHGVVDIVEDIAIAYGYNILPAEPLPPTHFSESLPIERLTQVVRDVMIGLGFDEVVNFMLTDSELIKLVSDAEFIKISNPKMKTYSAVRNSMMASMIVTAKENSETMETLEAFEVGDYVLVINDRPLSVRGLGFLLMGDKYTLTDGLVTIKALLKTLGIKHELKAFKGKPFIHGRAAEVLVNGVRVGVVGEVHPEVLVKVGISKPLVVGELSITEILNILCGFKNG